MITDSGTNIPRYTRAIWGSIYDGYEYQKPLYYTCIHLWFVQGAAHWIRLQVTLYYNSGYVIMVLTKALVLVPTRLQL